MPRDADAEPAHDGARLGLPADGVGSMADLGPRMLAFLIDSAVANGLAFLVFQSQGPNGLYVLGGFALEVWIFTAFLGGSVGHLVCGLEVLRLDHRPVGLWRSLIRTGLLCLLIPAAIWDRDGRGLHDLAAGTVLVRRR
jgi:uncharacterized RDD family membrane protein YckC